MKMMEQSMEQRGKKNAEDHIKYHRAEKRIEGREKLSGRRAQSFLHPYTRQDQDGTEERVYPRKSFDAAEH